MLVAEEPKHSRLSTCWNGSCRIFCKPFTATTKFLAAKPRRLVWTILCVAAASAGLLMLLSEVTELRQQGVSLTVHFALWISTMLFAVSPWSTVVPNWAAAPLRTVATVINLQYVDAAVQLTDKMVRHDMVENLYAPVVAKVGAALIVAASLLMMAFTYVIPAGYHVGGIPNVTSVGLKSIRGLLTCLGIAAILFGEIVIWSVMGNVKDSVIAEYTDLRLLICCFLLLVGHVRCDSEALDLAITYFVCWVYFLVPIFNWLWPTERRTEPWRASMWLIYAGVLLVLAAVALDRVRHRYSRLRMSHSSPYNPKMSEAVRSVPIMSQCLSLLLAIEAANIVAGNPEIDPGEWASQYMYKVHWNNFVAIAAILIPAFNLATIFTQVQFFRLMSALLALWLFPVSFYQSFSATHSHVGFTFSSIALAASTVLYNWDDMPTFNLTELLGSKRMHLPTLRLLLSLLFAGMFFSHRSVFESAIIGAIGTVSFVAIGSKDHDVMRVTYFMALTFIVSDGLWLGSSRQVMPFSNFGVSGVVHYGHCIVGLLAALELL